MPFLEIKFFFIHAAAQGASYSLREGLQRRFMVHARTLRVHRVVQFAVVIIGHFAPVPEEGADV